MLKYIIKIGIKLLKTLYSLIEYEITFFNLFYNIDIKFYECTAYNSKKN